ncbi:diguanylate cyclase [[Clostridium] innocuum]|nr:diguanylate cyclase [[Clostridium] innocuum]
MEQVKQENDKLGRMQAQMIEELPIAVSRHYLDQKLTLLWANTEFYQLTGGGKAFHSAGLKALFSTDLQEFYQLRDTLLSAKAQGLSRIMQRIGITVNGKRVWLCASAVLKQGNDDSYEVVICYTPIQEPMEKQERIVQSEKEMTENFKWMMSVYSGNVYISDMDSYELLYVNKHACDTLQTSASQLLGRKCYEAIQGLDAPCPFCTNAHLKKDQTYEWEFYNPNLKQTFMIKDRMLDWFGHRARIELSYDMYSEEYKLAKKDQEREAILKTIPAGMVRIDARDNNTILWYNGIFLEMIGYTPEQLEEELHYGCRSYIHPDDIERILLLRSKLKKTGDNVVLEARAYNRFKEERVWTVTLCYVSGEDSWDGIPSLYSTGLDITEERRQLERLRHKAEKDALTGINNRDAMKVQIKNYLQEQPDTMNALIMIDTDNFKQINDTLGHITGDLVLSEMAAGMKKIVRKSDLVGRIGGDEFTIFIKNITSPQTAEEKAEELLSMFRHLFIREKKPLKVTCSMGIALYPRDGESFQELYECADKALYQAKLHGKNNYHMYDPMEQSTLELLNNSSLGAAIDSEQRYAESPDNLARYVFRILYQYENLDEAIQLVLEVVGKQFDVSRSYIFENTEDGRRGANTYEWCNEGITSQREQLQDVEYSACGDYESLFKDNHVFYCRDITVLPSVLVDLFTDQGIHSTLQCAFYDREIFSGFVGFDECTGHRFWTREEISSLSLISQILAIFLKLKRMENRNR